MENNTKIHYLALRSLMKRFVKQSHKSIKEQEWYIISGGNANNFQLCYKETPIVLCANGMISISYFYDFLDYRFVLQVVSQTLHTAHIDESVYRIINNH